jgi:hypothetical protein
VNLAKVFCATDEKAKAGPLLSNFMININIIFNSQPRGNRQGRSHQGPAQGRLQRLPKTYKCSADYEDELTKNTLKSRIIFIFLGLLP